ncbi:hypothetical protein NE237_018738 [Protea cynaroides]|uniref:NAD(P)H-quinone oxidoreductase subunit 5, chloroplastic n=1 Tax=Protea cynaroides TaxID=273540 RepID=A0A9Q0KAI4_9MAGN|nr:hypothetical protein NE237_018738 [Protea cynaroides]
MSILITTVGILVLIYSDNYMSHDQGYLRFFTYMSFSNASMLGLVTSSNLIQIYIFWELVGMCSYLLIGFWFTRPIAANACQKAFVTNRVGDFGLLLGILGLYWITGSFEFRDLFEIFNNLIYNNRVNSLFVIFCASLLFGPTPISALIHAATMVAAGIFLVARLLPLFTSIPYIMHLISLIALGWGVFRRPFPHYIPNPHPKAKIILGSGSIIHSMETVVGYSPKKSQNMIFMGVQHFPYPHESDNTMLVPLLILVLFTLFVGFQEFLSDQIINKIYNWSYNRGYIDFFYLKTFINAIKGLAEFIYFFDKRVIDGITNGAGVTCFFVGEGVKYIGNRQISSYLFLYLSYLLIFLLIYYFCL